MFDLVSFRSHIQDNPIDITAVGKLLRCFKKGKASLGLLRRESHINFTFYFSDVLVI